MLLIDPMECPLYLVSRLSLVITSALKKRLTEAGLGHFKPAYLWALMSLWVEDGLKVTDIARGARLDTSTMTGLLDRMERDGLVMRTADMTDRRTLRIYLTDEGKRIQNPVIAETLQVLDECFGGIPEEDLNVTKATLAKVLARVREEGE
ncbi:MAG: MarR family transcriptional regulator [Desulfomonile tiedjei]|nr:MarR family transcriptional regulator [Desulfomonile tiedjei]